MRKLILFIASSLDGYIARKSGEVDWLFTDQEYGYDRFFARIDTVVMGRRTYEQVLSFGNYPYSEKRSFVFSKTQPCDRDATVQFIASDLADFLCTLKREPGKDIWLVGGAEIVRSCLQHQLIDEFIISIHPILLGEGIPLFPPMFPVTSLTLQHCETFNTGLVQLTYHFPQ